MLCMVASAATDYVVTVVYNGTTASVSIPSEISGYVTNESGTSSHVKLLQTSTSDANPGEIIYQLQGTSNDGEFYLTGEYKATIQLNGLTLNNPDSTAIHIKDGKRIKVSMNTGTINTLSDGTSDEESKGCFHSKGHTEFVGKGTLNVSSKIHHAIYSKEYIELKNCTINVTGAKKDAIHCQQYFKMSSGVVNISQADDDGIQVELKGETPTQATKDEDEDSGNFYMTGGSLTINGVGGRCIKTYGSISYTGGTQDFDKTNVEQYATTYVSSVLRNSQGPDGIYDLHGRAYAKDAMLPKGIYIVKEGNTTKKILVK